MKTYFFSNFSALLLFFFFSNNNTLSQINNNTVGDIIPSDCLEVALVETGGFQAIYDRLIDIGFDQVELISPTSELSTLELYDVVYLPSDWAAAFPGDFFEIDSHSDDYISYVNNGGGLLVEQPNPFGQANNTVSPSIIPYPITFHSGYESSDQPNIIDSDHPLTAGFSFSETIFSADTLSNIDENYTVLITGSISGYPSMLINHYGEGRILVETATANPFAFNIMSDNFLINMLNWVGTGSYFEEASACGEYTWTNGITYTESNGFLEQVITSSDACDSTLYLDLTIYENHMVSDEIISCEPYTWIDGNTYSESNNSASIEMTSSQGCDSTIQLNLTIPDLDISVTASNIELTSNQEDANYQWLDCDNDFSEISGETEHIYTFDSGNFAVEVSQFGCADTSDCISVIFDNIPELNLLNSLTYFPNPTENELNILLVRPAEKINVSVFDITGKEIYSSLVFNKNSLNISTAEWKAGVYSVILWNGYERRHLKILKL